MNITHALLDPFEFLIACCCRHPEWVGQYYIYVRLKVSASEEYDISPGGAPNTGSSPWECIVEPDTTNAPTSAPCGVTSPGTVQCTSPEEVAGLAGGVAGEL